MRIIVFFLLAFAGCTFVAIGIHWCNAKLELESGLVAGIFLAPIIPETFFAGIIACFLVVASSAWLSGIRLSLARILSACGMSVLLGFAVDIISTSAGRHESEYFLDGFENRVKASGIENDAVDWADRVFADASLNPNRVEEIYLAPDKLPAFFAPIFGEAGAPEARIYYDKNKGLADEIEIRMSQSVDWGIMIYRNSNEISDWYSKPKPRSCGKRLFVYINYYK